MINKQSGTANLWAIVLVVALVVGGVAFTLMRNDTSMVGPGEKMESNQNMMNSGAMMGPVEVPLSAQNASGQTGKVTVLEENGQTKVVIEVSSGPKGLAQPAHIHAGDCTSLGSIKYNLNDVVDGKSETVLQPAMHFIHGLGNTAVNIHKSKSELGVSVSCGNLREAFDRANHGDVMQSGMRNEGNVAIGQGAYKEYSEAVREAEQAAGKKVVLFFHAAWCPFCKAADGDFKSNTDQFPNDVTVLKVDYDNSAELKQKYGVTYQHTFVQIDSEENIVTKWVSGGTKELLANLK